MVDLLNDRFNLIRQDPQTGTLTFRGTLNPAPTDPWKAVFEECQATERDIGNLAVARINGDVIEFDASDLSAKAQASVIRRCIERTNLETVKRQAERQEQIDAQKKRVNDEWSRVQGKYREGI